MKQLHMCYYADILATEYMCILHDLLHVKHKVSKQLIEENDIIIGQCAVHAIVKLPRVLVYLVV
jgi:hypothetical protein